MKRLYRDDNKHNRVCLRYHRRIVDPAQVVLSFFDMVVTEDSSFLTIGSEITSYSVINPFPLELAILLQAPIGINSNLVIYPNTEDSKHGLPIPSTMQEDE